MDIDIGNFRVEGNLTPGNPRVATISDAPQIHNLLKAASGFGPVVPREISEIEDLIQKQYSFFVIDNPEATELLACASLEVLEHTDTFLGLSGLAEIRSVASLPLQHGLGAKVIRAALERAEILNIKDVFVTTDNIPYFHKRQFYEKRSGEKTFWLDTSKQPVDLDLVKNAEEKDREAVRLLMKGNNDMLPMEQGEFDAKYDQVLVYKKDGRIVGCVAPLVYGNPGHQKGIVRGLTKDPLYKNQGIDKLLLQACLNKFHNPMVRDAFITVPSHLENLYKSYGLFVENPTNISVLWWNGKS